MNVYIVYCGSNYEVDYPGQSCDVVGVCSSRENALKMIQDFCKIIEDLCNKNHDDYAKSDEYDGARIYYDIDNSIKERDEIFYNVVELDKIVHYYKEL